MIGPEEALIIGFISGGAFGYAVGFLLARTIYRSPTWPVQQEKA